jgi:DNA polymerase-3 subunit epsilon/CBS domain-containing protein
MQRLGIRHLGVRNRTGEIVGAVTSRNLLYDRAAAALVLGDEIGSGADSAALGRAWAKLPGVAKALLAEDIEPRTITDIVSSEIRILTRRAAQLAEARMEAAGIGRPPVAYAVLVLGSAGRGESLLAADQDNAIVYERGGEGGPEDRYFEALGAHMCEILDEIGVPYCKGGVMAKNRAWRMSREDWRATVDGWVRRQRPQDLLNVDIFFDAVTVHGDGVLGEELWHYAYEQGHGARDFLVALTEVASERANPFTLFGNFRLDEGKRIDLKKTGLLPIFGAARVLSIKHDVRARSTPARLRGVAAEGVGSLPEIEAIIEAHGTILGFMLRQQLADAEAGIPLSPRVAVDRLDSAEKKALRDALGRVDAAIDLVREGRF